LWRGRRGAFLQSNAEARLARRTIRTPGEPLSEFRKDHVTWSSELKFRGESYGWEAMILREGELSISRRFLLRSQAMAWADAERADIEKGWR
jgi:hypothetical protein